MSALSPVPVSVTRSVIEFVRKARKDAGEFDNVELLCESQVWSLHRLVAEAYAAGWDDGYRVGSEEARPIQ